MTKREATDLRVERGALPTRARVDARASLLFPLESTVVVLTRASCAEERIDRASFALVPRDTRYRVQVGGVMGTLASVFLGTTAVATASREYAGNIEIARFDALLSVPRVLTRTRWVDELVHRYVFERDVCDKHQSQASRFLETELSKEVFFLCKERDERRTRASVLTEEASVVARARAIIDEHLADPLPVAALAGQCHVSESTLLRAFARELGVTPGHYSRERRLEGALLLLKSERYGVGEVATRVGYASLAAFTGAFHRRFGAPPSRMRNAESALERLPPQGAAKGARPPSRKRGRV